MIQVHGTAVALGETAVLLRGPSGSGKSDLALRLIDGGARLVADDRVDLTSKGTTLVASAPSPLAGLLEVRGLGILKFPHIKNAPIGLVVDLVAPQAVERLPERQYCDLAGVALPLLSLAPFEASAPAKLRLAVRMLTGMASAVE
jgi:serine kinase of HPr protein (carbohydrate metabolism regulator)